MKRDLAAVVASAAVLLVAGCSGGQDTAPPPNPVPEPAPEYPKIEGPNVASSEQPLEEAAPTDEAATKVAIDYLNIRENAVSHTNADPSSWLGQVEPLMTAEGFAQLSDTYAGGSGGYPFRQAKEKKISVKVTSTCTTNPSMGEAPEGAESLVCRVVDQPLGEDGSPLPSDQVPDSWPYIGEQPPAMLSVVKEGDVWKVAADLTGQGG